MHYKRKFATSEDRDFHRYPIDFAASLGEHLRQAPLDVNSFRVPAGGDGAFKVAFCDLDWLDLINRCAR